MILYKHDTISCIHFIDYRLTCLGDEVHRKTDTLLSGNNMTAAGLKPQTLRSGGSSSNH